MNDDEFTILPPHFKSNVPSTVDWDLILPGYTSYYPASFRRVVPYLLASLSYHTEWLKCALHHTHPIFLSPVWTTGILISLKESVTSGYMLNSTSGLKATGIPPWVVITTRLNLLENVVDAFR